jgi:CheY-like chemotaxis protein
VDAEKLAETLDSIARFSERKVRQLLIVEDNPVERKSIVELVGNGDVASTAVGTASDALAALDRQEFDCIVLDLGLPDMSGFDLIDRVQERQRKRMLPIIVYTGRDLSHEQQNRLKRTTDTVIIKNARSPERLVAEAALYLHRVESRLPEEKQHMIRKVREHDQRLLGKRVLVVDDDMRNIFALTGILETRGMEVACAESGKDALELLQNASDPIDVVLMDIMMPGIDGYQTTREIRSLPEFENLPIIAVTAKAMKGDRDKCLEAGANDYITKPVDTDQLLSVLRVWLYDRSISVHHSAD